MLVLRIVVSVSVSVAVSVHMNLHILAVFQVSIGFDRRVVRGVHRLYDICLNNSIVPLG